MDNTVFILLYVAFLILCYCLGGWASNWWFRRQQKKLEEELEELKTEFVESAYRLEVMRRLKQRERESGEKLQ